MCWASPFLSCDLPSGTNPPRVETSAQHYQLTFSSPYTYAETAAKETFSRQSEEKMCNIYASYCGCFLIQKVYFYLRLLLAHIVQPVYASSSTAGTLCCSLKIQLILHSLPREETCGQSVIESCLLLVIEDMTLQTGDV